MADIVLNEAEMLPRSGIPIAAGLENVYISIAGLIGAGKTTLAKALGDILGLPVHYEPVTDNVYLEDFCARNPPVHAPNFASHAFPSCKDPPPRVMCVYAHRPRYEKVWLPTPDLPAEQAVPPAAADRLAGSGWCAGPHDL